MINQSNFIDKYRKYSLITILIVTGLVIFAEMRPFLGGILGAITIYILVRNQMRYLVEVRRLGRTFSAVIVLCETILFFLIPLSFVVLIIVDRVQTINIDPQQIIAPIQEFSDVIERRTGYDLFKEENLNYVLGLIPRVGQYLMGAVTSFIINIIVLLFVLYFMLIGGRKMELYIFEVLPFNDSNKKDVMHEINLIVTSNAIGIPLLGIIQGIIAGLGYYFFSVPNPVFFGFLTCIATIMPVIGTAIVWVPLCIYMATIGEWALAVGLTLYGTIVISQIDNIVRFMLQKKMADIHPLITIFGVIIGISLFGFMGVIFGPLLLSMFMVCFTIFKKQYLRKNLDSDSVTNVKT